MSENEIKELDRLKMHYIDSLGIAMRGLKQCAERTLNKIEAEGIAGYYSGNSDVHRYASNAWRSSWALCELRALEEKLLAEMNTKIKINDKQKKKKAGKKKK